ncbi:calmodulin-like [Cimex lectularius]|uniref:EF-hand domain-containing protein n=1 Tax=Cimex lectularius TaxID=79782 RepID=A0A8I6RLL6_CIMLE|nr:calmodulin-like [Cimex lectularius]
MLHSHLVNTRTILSLPRIFKRQQSKCAEGTEFSPDEVEKFHQCFLKFDRDDDNKLDRWEFTNFAKWVIGTDCNITDLNNIFSKIDQNKDQYISVDELMSHLEKRYVDQSKKQIMQTFSIFDKNCDGLLNFCEAKTAIIYLGEDILVNNLKEIFMSVDKDKDDRIDLKEFVQLICHVLKN